MNKFILKTASGKFMSEIYTLNRLDFETIYENDAKKFDSIDEANSFIKDSGFDKEFIWPVKFEVNE
jgi:hypothetical protein